MIETEEVVIARKYEKVTNNEKGITYSDVCLFEKIDNNTYQLVYDLITDTGKRMMKATVKIEETSNKIDVYVKDIYDKRKKRLLFSWDKNKDVTPYFSNGDFEMSAEFAWQLCYEIDHDFS